MTKQKPQRKALRVVKRRKLSSPAGAAPFAPVQPSTAALTAVRRQAALKGWETRRRLDAIGDALLTPPEKRDRYQIGLLRSVDMDWEPEPSPTDEMGAKPSEAEPPLISRYMYGTPPDPNPWPKLAARIRSWWRKVWG